MKTLQRRDFLRLASLAAIGGFIPGATSCNANRSAEYAGLGNALGCRENFRLDPEKIHMAALLLASHPDPVRAAINEYRNELDADPVGTVRGNYGRRLGRVREAGAAYMGVQEHEIAITDSTTMGTALFVNGLQIREDQEMVAADFDYRVTHESMEFKALRTGAAFRKFSLYNDVRNIKEEELIDNYIAQVRENTRLITGTWVHSATGLKIPVRQIAGRLAEINADRSPADRVIFFVDGVHGLGVENQSIGNLGCDFLSAGTHKWMYGPRGTGVLWGRSGLHDQVLPTIPTFNRGAGWGGEMTPGGYKPFEHQWSMAEAFQFHSDLGRQNVEDHIHSLARQLKEGLAGMDHVVLYTPMADYLSSGIVCFDVNGISPRGVVRNLANQNIIASTTPYTPTYARLSPGIFNSGAEMDEVLRAIRGMA